MGLMKPCCLCMGPGRGSCHTNRVRVECICTENNTCAPTGGGGGGYICKSPPPLAYLIVQYRLCGIRQLGQVVSVVVHLGVVVVERTNLKQKTHVYRQPFPSVGPTINIFLFLGADMKRFSSRYQPLCWLDPLALFAYNSHDYCFQN